ncbi:Disease resistance RPP13-like protein 4, partial [Mucuna pruriens]
MSIRTNPMKAVATMLKRLMAVEHQANLKDLKSELINIKDLFSMVKKNEDELLDTLTLVDGYLRNSNLHKLMQEKQDICNRIRNSTVKLLPAGAIQSTNIQVAQSSKINNREEAIITLPSRPQPKALQMIKVNYNSLDRLQKRLFLFVLPFPENTVMKISNITRWWLGVREDAGLHYNEKDCDKVFDELLHRKLIVPYCESKCPVVNKFKINPLVRHKSMTSLLQNDEQPFCGIYSKVITSSHPYHNEFPCLALDQYKVKISDVFGSKSTHWRAIFNVGASYLNFRPQWMVKMKNLEVLQLGHWLHESAKHHIEVQSEEFLKELRDQKHLKYLSLRGISRIFELPPSILQLESLETLDLKACHNLETLPNDISSLRNLRHLDLSRCYLLDRMPTGIDKLTNLEVLKGFVIGNSSKTPYTIFDLAKLKNLKRLSVHIQSGAMIQDREFERFEELSKLEHLKISWGVSDTRYSDIQIILPLNLMKLHLEGFLGENIPKWFEHWSNYPSMELNITGGKLKSLDDGQVAMIVLGVEVFGLSMDN